MKSKKQGTSESAHRPKDAVQGDETVRVPQDSINGTESTGIEFRFGHKSVLVLAKAIN